MPHIHTEPGQHDLTTSAFIVKLSDEQPPKILMHMHKKLGKYLQVGGHVELHENPWQALQHEIAEESGYQMQQLGLLQPEVRLKRLSNSQLHPQPVQINTHRFSDDLDHYHIDLAYAFVTKEEPKGTVAENESSEIVFFSTNELKNLPKEKIFEDVRNTALFVLNKILDKWEVVEDFMH